MKKIESIAKEILLYMIDLERYGWPPSCTGIVYQPERPYAIKQQTDNKSLKSTDQKGVLNGTLENRMKGLSYISITPGASGVSGSFSLSSVKNQWSLVCTVSGIPY